jgi:hypothetical protein
VGGTPPGPGDPIETKPLRLVTQPFMQVEVPGPFPFSRCSAALHHLRTYFITGAADTYPTVHYNITWGTSRAVSQLFHSPAQNPAGGAPPSGMEQSHRPPWHNEIDRDAIGDSHRQEDPRRGRDPPVDSLDLDPALADIQAHHLDAVHLVT